MEQTVTCNFTVVTPGGASDPRGQGWIFRKAADLVSGLLLVCKTAAAADLYMLKRKALDKYCVKTLKKRKLRRRKDTVWQERLNLQEDCEPVWRLLKKKHL